MEFPTDESPRVEHPLIDGHTHLDQFGPGHFPHLLARARNANVGLLISAGTTLESCRRAQELAEAEPDVWAGVGLHGRCETDSPGRVAPMAGYRSRCPGWSVRCACMFCSLKVATDSIVRDGLVMDTGGN